jgi:hypothetical protein
MRPLETQRATNWPQAQAGTPRSMTVDASYNRSPDPELFSRSSRLSAPVFPQTEAGERGAGSEEAAAGDYLWPSWDQTSVIERWLDLGSQDLSTIIATAAAAVKHVLEQADSTSPHNDNDQEQEVGTARYKSELGEGTEGRSAGQDGGQGGRGGTESRGGRKKSLCHVAIHLLNPAFQQNIVDSAQEIAEASAWLQPPTTSSNTHNPQHPHPFTPDPSTLHAVRTRRNIRLTLTPRPLALAPTAATPPPGTLLAYFTCSQLALLVQRYKY